MQACLRVYSRKQVLTQTSSHTMISSQRKISRDLFKTLMEKGHSFHSESFSVRIAPLFLGGGSKFAVVVPKRIEKSAVKRNAIKRRFYRVIESLLLVAKPDLLYSFFVKKNIAIYPFETLRSEVLSVAKKANIVFT